MATNLVPANLCKKSLNAYCICISTDWLRFWQGYALWKCINGLVTLCYIQKIISLSPNWQFRVDFRQIMHRLAIYMAIFVSESLILPNKDIILMTGNVRGPPISAQLWVQLQSISAQLRSCKLNSGCGCATPTPEMQLWLHLRTCPLATRLFASHSTVQSLLTPTWHI